MRSAGYAPRGFTVTAKLTITRFTHNTWKQVAESYAVLRSGAMKEAGFAVIYRWKVRTEAREAFVAAWKEATKAYRTIGALGSRLHLSDGGDFYAYAEWPSREMWEDSKTLSPVDAATAATMRNATLEFEMWPLAIEADLLARSLTDTAD